MGIAKPSRAASHAQNSSELEPWSNYWGTSFGLPSMAILRFWKQQKLVFWQWFAGTIWEPFPTDGSYFRVHFQQTVRIYGQPKPSL